MNKRQRYINYLEWTIKDCKRHDRPTHLMAVSNMEHILDLLKHPTLPEEPTEELLNCLTTPTPRSGKLYEGSIIHKHTLERYKALYAALSTPTAPKTKRVKVWRVEYYDTLYSIVTATVCNNPQSAQRCMEVLKGNSSMRYICINIIEDTQEVPDDD